VKPPCTQQHLHDGFRPRRYTGRCRCRSTRTRRHDASSTRAAGRGWATWRRALGRARRATRTRSARRRSFGAWRHPQIVQVTCEGDQRQRTTGRDRGSVLSVARLGIGLRACGERTPMQCTLLGARPARVQRLRDGRSARDGGPGSRPWLTGDLRQLTVANTLALRWTLTTCSPSRRCRGSSKARCRLSGRAPPIHLHDLRGLTPRGKSLEGKTTKGVPDSMVGKAPATCLAAVEYTTQATGLQGNSILTMQASGWRARRRSGSTCAQIGTLPKKTTFPGSLLAPRTTASR